jgi:hypothetical protein
MPQFLYGALCPYCRFSTPLLETTLAEMIRNRQVASTGEPFLMFVCQRCTKCFPWNYAMRQPLSQYDALSRADPVWISIVAECESGDCKGQTELIAIRPHGTTKEEILRERPTWNAKDIYCDNGHRIIIPL